MAVPAAIVAEDSNQGIPMVGIDDNGWRLGTERMAVAVVVGNVAASSVPGIPLRSMKRSKFGFNFEVNKYKYTSILASASASSQP